MKARWLLMLALSLTCLTGCREFTSMWFEQATIYANTLTVEKDGFTNRSPQWAYEGEPVVFDFAPDPSVSDYAVFVWPGGKPDVLTKQQLVKTYFRGVGIFKAGREPRKNTVQAFAYCVQGDRDWYYDQDAKKWAHHLTMADEADFEVGKATMEIVCYRVTIDMGFKVPKGRRVTDMVLQLVKDDGTRVSRRMRTSPDDVGFELTGPDGTGEHRVRYTPKWEEVNRVGKTDVELVLSYDDGTQRIIKQTLDTP